MTIIAPFVIIVSGTLVRDGAEGLGTAAAVVPG